MSALSRILFWVYVAALLAIGGAGVLVPAWELRQVFHLPLDALDPESRASLLNQFRFLKAIEVGFGLFAVTFRRQIFSARPFNALFVGVVLLAAGARLLSIAADGRPSASFIAFTLFELATGVVLYAASRAIPRRSAGASLMPPPGEPTMQQTSSGITFRESMSGPFALGEIDPRAGEREGKQRGTALTMRCTVEIQDIDRFIDDPAHAGQLTGTVDFPPLGIAIPARRGMFNLFATGTDRHERLMIYELAFDVGEESYYLAGQKHVRDDPGFDLWKDTTTLYTRLYRGGDASGPVVGSGVLRLDAGDFAALLTTIRGTAANSVGERADAVVRFGHFFLGELWETYGRTVAP